MFTTRPQYQFKASPMLYMKGKIEEARMSTSASRTTEYSDLKMSRWTENINECDLPAISETMSDASEQADDELSSTSSISELLSPPGSPLLPCFHKIGAMQSSYKFTRPISIILFFALIYVTSSSALTILSRFNMYQATYKFPFPLSLLAMQLIFTEAAIIILGLVARVAMLLLRWKPELGAYISISDPFYFSFNLRPSDIAEHFPIIASFLISQGATVACLVYVPMNNFVLFLIPMLPIQFLLARLLAPLTVQARPIITSCLALMVGYILVVAAAKPSVHGAPGYNFMGCLTGLLASVAFPVQNSLVARTLSVTNHRIMRLFYVVISASTVIILPMLLISGEYSAITKHCWFLDELGFWLMMMVLCIVSALASVSSFTLMSYISPLTLTVVHVARTALLMGPFSGWMNRDTFGFLHSVGWVISSGALLTYLFYLNVHRPRFGFTWNTGR